MPNTIKQDARIQMGKPLTVCFANTSNGKFHHGRMIAPAIAETNNA